MAVGCLVLVGALHLLGYDASSVLGSVYDCLGTWLVLVVVVALGVLLGLRLDRHLPRRGD